MGPFSTAGNAANGGILLEGPPHVLTQTTDP